MTDHRSSEDIGPIGPGNLMRFRHGGVVYDQVRGIGQIPDVENIEYLGFVALMKPSTYLKLCPPLNETTKSPTLLSAIREGKSVSMGYLAVDLSDDELVVREQEGRNRAWIIRHLHGDEPIPVAFLLQGGDRARHVTEDDLSRIAAGIRRKPSEHEASLEHLLGWKTPFVEGPLFERVFILGQEREISLGRSASPAP